jgi:hypothetical protein
MATTVAGPLYGALPNSSLQIGLLAWLYVSAVVWLGIGLHSFLARWTTLTVVGLFVMLNFTSAGGVFAPSVQPGFFASLHSFWIGSGLVEAARRLLYFPALGIGGQVLTIALWAVVGLALATVAGLAEGRRNAPAVAAAPAPTPVPAEEPDAVDDGATESPAEEEIEEAVGV